MRVIVVFQVGTITWERMIGASIEQGGYYSSTGSYNAFELNMIFTDVLHHGGIYHLMSHLQP